MTSRLWPGDLEMPLTEGDQELNRFGEENQGLGFGSLKLEAEIWKNTKTGQLHTGQEQKKCVKYHRRSGKLSLERRSLDLANKMVLRSQKRHMVCFVIFTQSLTSLCMGLC